MRYYTQSGAHPEINATIFIAGPQDESQMMKEVRDILAREGITRVAVFYNHGLGDRVEIVEAIKEPDHAD